MDYCSIGQSKFRQSALRASEQLSINLCNTDFILANVLENTYYISMLDTTSV